MGRWPHGNKEEDNKKPAQGSRKARDFSLRAKLWNFADCPWPYHGGFRLFGISGNFYCVVPLFCFGMFGVVGYAPACVHDSRGIWAIAARGHMPKGYQLLMGGLGFLSLLSLIELCYARPFGPGQIGYFPYLQECYQSALGVMGGGLLGGLFGISSGTAVRSDWRDSLFWRADRYLFHRSYGNLYSQVL